MSIFMVFSAILEGRDGAVYYAKAPNILPDTDEIDMIVSNFKPTGRVESGQGLPGQVLVTASKILRVNQRQLCHELELWAIQLVAKVTDQPVNSFRAPYLSIVVLDSKLTKK